MKIYLIYYLIFINIISFLTMFIDKKKAIKRKWRIKESTLFLLSFIGGSLGVILGIYSFRHKTKHIKFTLGIPLILIVQVLLFIFIKY
ncbi:DUF1294 domain-containing protein [Clostridium sartagoforme]|uniref:DUF1294 domain-containing protein n=1 Tax=Clostridium sartagoforme TaxID=84031 RepID=A0A4S2DTV2_9CLOT|nr:DUF1294 domain-containing protein [Clostridium sartagoforme]TGY44481.1 DUF1294 domain-containing protein [Clostridium sartagoforme]